MNKKITVLYGVDGIEEHFDKEDLLVMSVKNDIVFEVNMRY